MFVSQIVTVVARPHSETSGRLNNAVGYEFVEPACGTVHHTPQRLRTWTISTFTYSLNLVPHVLGCDPLYLSGHGRFPLQTRVCQAVLELHGCYPD